MRKQLAFLSLMLLSNLAGQAQITIEGCYEKARANYPFIKQYDWIEQTKAYHLSNANKGYLPQVALSAKATYQSDVTQMPFDLSKLGMPNGSVPTLSNNQYGMALDINQTVWDGGAIKTQKEGIRASTEVEKKNIEVNIHAIYERVNQIYFGILLTQAQLEQNQILQDELKRTYEQVLSYRQNGIANQTDLDAIKVDQLKCVQNNIRLIHTKIAYIEMLSKLIGEPLTASSNFIKPSPVRPATNKINRPELNLFNAQLKELEIKNHEITSGLMPKLGLFITGGYGRPGLNMLKDDFSAYYVGGIKLYWNIGSFYTQKNKRNQIQTQMNSVHTQCETFLFNTTLNITQIDRRIDSYFEQLKYDDEIISLRHSVKLASESKMANGTLSGTDLMRDIHAEQMAIQDKLLHEMELLLAIYNLKYTTNQ